MKLEETQVAWRGGDSAHDMICPPELAAAIAAAAFENFRRFSRGGLEIGGVLLGKRTETGLSVERWLPIECEHARGPAFLLSNRDEEVLTRSLTDARAAGLEVIGWFVSHGRSVLALSDCDLEIFDRFFPEAWQVTLLIKPAMDATVRARICSRHTSGIVFGPEFRFDGAVVAPANSRPVTARKTLPAPEPKKPVRVHRGGEERAPTPDGRSEVLSRVVEPPRFLVSRPAAGSTRWVILALGTLCLILAALVFASNLSALLPRSAVKLGLRAIDTGGQLRVEWNTDSPLVQESQHATVEVNDGGKVTKLLLNPNHLRMGSFQFVRQSSDVEFIFTLHRANQPAVHELTRFVSYSAGSTSAEPSNESSPPEPPASDRLRELEDENKRLQAALQEEIAKRIRQEQAVRILRQHLGFK